MYIVILLNLGFDIWLKIRHIEEISGLGALRYCSASVRDKL